MKIMYIIIPVLLIIGAGVIVVKRDSNKDMTPDINSNVEPQGSATTTVTNGVPTSQMPSQAPAPINVTTGNGAHVTSSNVVNWSGKYQIVEFGNVVPDSSPMKYDAYAYTDITVTSQSDSYTVSIVRTKDTHKTTLQGRGVVNAVGALEVYSSDQSLLFTLDTYKSDRVNADTQFTWVDLKPQLSNTAGVYYMKRQSL